MRQNNSSVSANVTIIGKLMPSHIPSYTEYFRINLFPVLLNSENAMVFTTILNYCNNYMYDILSTVILLNHDYFNCN